MSEASRDEGAWWEFAVIYEIALVSFQDSDGDGKGDLAGLTSRIDYLKWLGVDAVWLTPVYKSPFRDLGYDISDYCSIDPAFGNLEAFRPPAQGPACGGDPRDPRSRAQPYCERSRMVRREQQLTEQREGRLVHLGRRGRERRPAQQLAEPLWRQRLGMV